MDQPISTYLHILAWTTYAQSLALPPSDPLVATDASPLADISKTLIAHAHQQNQLEHPHDQQPQQKGEMVAEEESLVKLEEMSEEQSDSKSAISAGGKASAEKLRGRYRSYSVELKQQIVEEIKKEVEETGDIESKVISRVAKRHQIHTKNVNRWFKEKVFNVRSRQRKCQFPKMEARLIDHVIQHRKNGLILKRCRVIQKAKDIMRELYPDAISVFQYSKGWYERFKSRLERKIRQAQQPNEQQIPNNPNQIDINLNNTDKNAAEAALQNDPTQPNEVEVKLEEKVQANS